MSTKVFWKQVRVMKVRTHLSSHKFGHIKKNFVHLKWWTKLPVLQHARCFASTTKKFRTIRILIVQHPINLLAALCYPVLASWAAKHPVSFMFFSCQFDHVRTMMTVITKQIQCGQYFMLSLCMLGLQERNRPCQSLF